MPISTHSRAECDDCKQQRFCTDLGGRVICRDCVHKALNNKVLNFIQNEGPVHDVIDHIEATQEIVGKSAIATAVETVKCTLTTRLREAATDSIYEGKDKVSQANVQRLSRALSDAKSCSYLDAEVDLTEFDHLLRNLEVRSRVAGGGDDGEVQWLVQQLQSCEKAPASGPPLTDMTLTAVCAELLRLAKQKPLACSTIAKLGAVASIRKILLGELDRAAKGTPGAQASVSSQGPQHPELQVFMAMLLAEIALQATADKDTRQGGWSASAVSGGHDARADTPGGFVLAATALPCVTPTANAANARRMAAGLPGESQTSLDILISGLRAGSKRGEHSLVWAVMRGLRRAAEHPKHRQHLVALGVVPVIKRTIEFYAAADASLPKPEARPTAKALTLNKEPPPFMLKSRTQAVFRRDCSVKDSWLRGYTASTPALPGLSRRTSAVQWLAGSPTSIAGRFNQKGSLIAPRSRADTDTSFAAPDSPMSASFFIGEATPASPARSKSKWISDVQNQSLPVNGNEQATKKTRKVKPKEQKFPSLMWLLSEDGVDENAFYRCCDKGMVVLQARWLLHDIEHAAEVRRKSATVDIDWSVAAHRNSAWDYGRRCGVAPQG